MVSWEFTNKIRDSQPGSACKNVDLNMFKQQQNGLKQRKPEDLCRQTLGISRTCGCVDDIVNKTVVGTTFRSENIGRLWLRDDQWRHFRRKAEGQVVSIDLRGDTLYRGLELSPKWMVVVRENPI